MNTYWIVFFTTAFVLNISPGPDMLYLITQTLSRGKKVGFATMLGLGTGAMIHSLFVALGISIIISTSIVAFTIIKYIGVAYLFYLGIKAIFFGGTQLKDIVKTTQNESFVKSWIQAVIIDLTNPKVALFFIAFLPQFYRDNGTSKLSQFMTLGSIIVIMGFFLETLIVIMADTIAGILKQQSGITKMIDKIFGLTLISLGIKLFFEENR